MKNQRLKASHFSLYGFPQGKKTNMPNEKPKKTSRLELGKGKEGENKKGYVSNAPVCYREKRDHARVMPAR